MQNTSVGKPSPYHVRNIAMDLVWTILTCGIYNIYVNAKQIDALNAMLGHQKYDFWPWFIFSILTCGLYHIYHEYRMSVDLAALVPESKGHETIICVVLLIFGITPVVDAIQQSQINKFHGNTAL